MRYTCDDPAAGGSFVEYSDRWSRGEQRTAWAAEDDALLDVLRPKIVAVRLLCADGHYLDDPAALTVEDLDAVDLRVFRWFAGTWVACLNDLANLGNAWRRQLFATSAPEPTVTPATKTETTAAA
jgi:hypothetical protein